jgi:hypothetical protein
MKNNRRMIPGAIAVALALAVVASAAFLGGCEDAVSWTPRGDVKFLDLKEKLNAQGEKTASLEYSIRNGGKSKIAGSVFAFTFSTDVRSYRCTVVDENAIVPGALIYGRVSIAYEAPSETGDLARTVVDSAQFK